MVIGKKYFSSLDCKSGFWQIRLDEKSKPLTSFSCPQGQFQRNVVPFGSKQAPGLFQRYMDNILKPFKDIYVEYVDDILIYSDTKEQHLKDVEEILKICKDNGVVISKKKAVINQQKIKFLGFEIDNGRMAFSLDDNSLSSDQNTNWLSLKSLI